MRRFPVALYNITESDGVMWGNTNDGEEICVRGTYEYRDTVVCRDGKRTIPYGIFCGRMRAFPDQDLEVHFKNESGMLIERPQYLHLPIRVLRYNASIAVLSTPLGEQVLIWQPGATWDPERGHFVGYFGNTLLCVRT